MRNPFKAAVLAVLVVTLAGGSAGYGGDEHALYLRTFEPGVRADAKAAATGSPLDLRVARGVGARGYDKARVSVVSATGVDLSQLEGLVGTVYNDTFQFRWQAGFDLGAANTSCRAAVGVFSSTVRACDMDCLLACTEALPRCRYYTWFPAHKKCQLADASCEYAPSAEAEATYATTGRNVLSSAVVASTNGLGSCALCVAWIEYIGLVSLEAECSVPLLACVTCLWRSAHQHARPLYDSNS